MATNILIAWYSHSGNTRRVADELAAVTGGDLCPIEPVTPYPPTYQQVLAQSEKEIKAGFCPELKEFALDLLNYDVIFVGTPNWYGTIAPPVATFLKHPALSGKVVAPFVTHGGGGAATPYRAIKELCKGATVTPCFDVYGSGGGALRTELEDFVRRIEALG